MAAGNYALVTGGTRGIGLEVAKALVAKGQPVLFTARNAESGSKVKKTLLEASPSAVVECLSLDAADDSSIKQLADVVHQKYDQQIDLLVSNSSVTRWCVASTCCMHGSAAAWRLVGGCFSECYAG